MVTITCIYYTFLTETPPVLVKNGQKCRGLYVYRISYIVVVVVTLTIYLSIYSALASLVRRVLVIFVLVT